MIARTPVTAVPAGRAVGKGFLLLPGIVLWWLYTCNGSGAITTWSNFRQVVGVLCSDLRSAMESRHDESGRPVSPRIPLSYDHLSKGFASSQQLKLGIKWEGQGFASDTDTGFSVQHSADQPVIVDVARGVGPALWSGIDGWASRRHVVGNPIMYDCLFGELHDLRMSDSPTIHSVPISTLVRPHATLERSPMGAVCTAFFDRMREVNGENSPWWLSDILRRDSVRFIPVNWVDACMDLKVLNDDLWKDYPDGLPRSSVDVRGGVGADRSTIIARNHKRLLEAFATEWHGVLDDGQHLLEPEVVRISRHRETPPGRVTHDRRVLGRNSGSYIANRDFDGGVDYFGAGRGGMLYVNRRTSVAFAAKRRLDPHLRGKSRSTATASQNGWRSTRS